MSVSDMFWAAPPVSRTITAAAVLLSVPVWTGIVDPYLVVFLKHRLFTYTSLPQLWRLVTPFFLTGPKLGLLLDPYFLFTYGKSLETEGSRFTRPGDFFIYLVFVACMILLTGGLYLDGPVLLSPLTLALAYTFAQENPNRQMTYFIVTFSSKWLPYAMLAMTLVMGSPQEALLQATGLIAAHAYDFVTKYWPEYGGGSRWLSTPQFVQGWFAQPQGTASQRAFGTSYSGRPTQPQNVPQQPAGANRGGAWGSGFNSTPWSTRGQGRRLGGE